MRTKEHASKGLVNLAGPGMPAVFLLLAAALLATGCAHLDHNFRTVEKGKYYRSGQMPASSLDIKLRRYGIATVINLRGESPHEEWYRKEKEACLAAGVAHIDLDWSKNKLPEPESLARFVRAVRESSGPLLVHCQGGVHRSGVAAACYMLIEDRTVEEARRQLGMFFNDAPIGRLLEIYGQGVPFEQWVVETYPRLYEEEQNSRR